MIRYTPSSVAETLSEALWALSRPSAVRQPGEVTTRLFVPITALDGSTWLQVVDDYEINVHPLAEFNGIAGILQPWIDAGDLPADTNLQLAALVESKRGGKLVPWEAFPQFFKEQAKTLQEMIAAGLLAQPDVQS